MGIKKGDGTPPSPDAGLELLRAAQQGLVRAVSHPAVEQMGAVMLQLGASYAAYNATLALTHVTAGVARIHCATPLLGSLWGLASVSAASAAAGHVSRSTLAALQRAAAAGSGLGGAVAGLPAQLAVGWDGGEAAVDAVLGPVVYLALSRHNFFRLLPSHLAKPGAFARLHVPTSAAEYSTAAEKAQLSVLFGRDGCHHCGTRRNGVIGDHMPPYKVVKDALAAREAAGGWEKTLRRVADAIGLKDTSLQQVYYAQCRDCSSRQSQLMRNGTRTTALPGVWPPELVVHSPARLAARQPLPSLLVGLRCYVAAAVRQGGSGSGSGPYGGMGGGGGGKKQRGRGKDEDNGVVGVARGGWFNGCLDVGGGLLQQEQQQPQQEQQQPQLMTMTTAVVLLSTVAAMVRQHLGHEERPEQEKRDPWLEEGQGQGQRSGWQQEVDVFRAAVRLRGS